MDQRRQIAQLEVHEVTDLPVEAALADLASDADQVRTRAYAERLSDCGDAESISALVICLRSKDKHLRRAAAHVVGEIADRRPDLFLPHVSALFEIVRTGSGPAVWESLHALADVARHDPTALAPYRDTVVAALDGPSVIARDNAVRILVGIAALVSERSRAMQALVQTLAMAPVNQLPMYAELIAPVTGPEEADDVRRILIERLASITQPSKIRRIEAVLRKLPGA